MRPLMSTVPNASGPLAPVFRRIERFLVDKEIDGAALAVVHRGELAAEWYCGDASPGRRAAPDTIWPLVCISKVYTAATVMALVERGELTLSMPVSAHLPAFKREGLDGIRLRHLLTHTSGLSRATPPRVEELISRQATLDEQLDDAFAQPPLFHPGTAFKYTDHGYAFAAQLAETVMAVPFSELVRTMVLQPAGLYDTFFPPHPSVYDRIAYVAGVPAEGSDGAFLNSDYFRQLAHPGLGAFATLRDLLQFGLLFTTRPPVRVLSAATVRSMTTDQTGGHAVGHVMPLYAPQRQPWGFGWSIRGSLGNGIEDLASPETFDHVGAAGAIVAIDPRSDITIAYTSNRFVHSNLEAFVGRLSAVVGMVLAALT
jgi:CubicO group peptidase (beta-lactamase class C family)